MGREEEGRETLAASPPAPAPSRLRWAGVISLPRAIPGHAWRCMGARQCSEPPIPSRSKAPLRPCAGISLEKGLTRGKAGEETQSFPTALPNQPLPISPSPSPSVLTLAAWVEPAAAEELQPSQQQPLRNPLCLPRFLILVFRSPRCDAILPRAQFEASIQGNRASAVSCARGL